jgi:hypothetical protein
MLLNKLKSRKILVLSLFLSVCCFLILYGCDQTFQPISDNGNFTFSIYGYLDASADTQWVRITPARKQLAAFQEVPEMHVTLTHLETGNTTVMNDSLQPFGQGFNVLNVWTTMDIEPEQSYKLWARRSDGAESHVTVTIPPDFPTPVLYTNENGASGDLHFNGVERVADVQTLWKEKRRRVPYRQYVRKNPTPENNYSENSYIVGLLVGWDMRYFYGTPPPQFDPLQLEPRQVFVASGGPEWNEEIPSLSDLEYATIVGISNVEGGVGYLVGILSKTIPFKGCFDEQREHIACPTEKPFF